MKPLIEGGDIVEPLNERVLGRTLLNDLVEPKTNSIILSKGYIAR
jgi:DNA-directed RNA polymerase subunit beta'